MSATPIHPCSMNGQSALARDIPALVRYTTLIALTSLMCYPGWSAEPTDETAIPGWRAPEVGAELTLEIQTTDGLDAPGETVRDVTATELELRLSARQHLTASTEVRAALDLTARRYSESIQVQNEDDLLWSVHQLFVDHDSANKAVRWRFGRQTLDDRMGWFVDEELDGLRFTGQWKAMRADISYTRKDWVEVGSAEREDEIDNLLAAVHIEGLNKSRWTPYLLHRSAQVFAGDDATETQWLGLQGVVRLDKRVAYWVNGSVRDGTRDTDEGKRKLGGHAVDAGLSWTLDRSYQPTVTVGYARASGDGNTDDNEDGAFRQSGLHNNEFRLNGGNRFRYFGEVLDPELTNLEILTVGFGVRPKKRWAVDVAWHRYTQVKLEDRIRGADIEFEPSGTDDAIGDSLDVVLGLEPKKDLTIQVVAGLFVPGKAFDDSVGNAWLGRLEVEYEF